jgi:hypothetical protein
MPQAVTQQQFAAALLDPGATPTGLTTARGVPDAARFAVYRNNVIASLGKALEQKFPVTLQLVGDEFFRGMARAFIAGNRPRSPIIAEYGDALPAFIAGFRPADTVPYLADVARIEMAWALAYHAADAVPMGVETLAGIAAEALPAIRLAGHPSASLIRSAYPVGSIWAAHQGEVVEPVRHSDPESILVIRPDAEVSVHVLPQTDAVFAEALLGGATLEAAAKRALAADVAFDFGRALVGLIGLGVFCALAVPSPKEAR